MPQRIKLILIQRGPAPANYGALRAAAADWPRFWLSGGQPCVPAAAARAGHP
jgi:hypothetical protein